MQADQSPSLEAALARTEADIESALKASAAVTKALKRFQAATRTGNLRDLEPALTGAEQALAALRHQVANTKDGWEFDETTYFEDGAYVRERLATAERLRVQIFRQEDRLYCYPTLVRVLGRERAVLI